VPSHLENQAPIRRQKAAGVARYVAAFRTPQGIAAAVILMILFGASLLAPVIFPQGFDVQTRDTLHGASLAHPFGTDAVGRDVFVRTVYGLRTDVSAVSGTLTWMIAGAVLAVAILSKFGACTLGARLGGMNWRDATCVGLLMNTRALMCLIVINIGYDGFSAKTENGILSAYGFDHDEGLLSAYLYFVDAFKPLLGNKDSLAGHLYTHSRLQVNGRKSIFNYTALVGNK
jgi:hypothetical protein